MRTMTLSITTVFFATLTITSLSIECHYTECPYAECRGTMTLHSLTEWVLKFWSVHGHRCLHLERSMIEWQMKPMGDKPKFVWAKFSTLS